MRPRGSGRAAVPQRVSPDYTRREPMGPELLRPRVPRAGEWGAGGAKARGESRTGRLFRAHVPPACPGAQKPLRSPEAGGGRLEWDLGKCSPVGPGRGAAGRRAGFGSMESGTPRKNGLQEILQTNGQRAGQSRWLSLRVTARPPQLPARQHVIW